MRGSDLLVQSLAQAGVKHVFGMPGHTAMPVLDAIAREPGIRFILAKHENTLVSMADGYARVSHEPGVCVTHVGPSAANLLNGVGSAYRDSSPVIVITCNEVLNHLDRDPFNSWDQMTPFRSITKWSVQAKSAREIPRLMRSAFVRASLGRRGPVQIDIPVDVAAEEVAAMPAVKKPAYASYSSRARPDPVLALEIVHQLLRSSRPLILAGAGVNWADANAELLRFAEMTGLPVAVTSGGRGAFPESHPLFAGVPGRGGNRAASEALKESDFILALGSRLSDYTTLTWTLIDPSATIAQVDIDPTEIARQYPVDVGVLADCRMFLQDAIEIARPLLSGSAPLPGSGRAKALSANLAAEKRSRLEADLDSVPIQARRVLKEIAEAIRPDAIVTVGAGRHTHLVGEQLAIHEPRCSVRPIGFGAMGFAFPAAMGAKLARPERQVLCLVGDGDFSQCMQDVETAMREKIKVIVVVFNDSSFSSVKLLQQRQFGRNIGVDFLNTNFAKFAEIYGARGFRVERPEQFKPALQASFEEDRPCVIDVLVDEAEKTGYGVFSS